MTFIHDFGLLFLIIVLFSFIVKLAKQPIIIGYVLAGLFFSFYLTDPSRSNEIIILSELGITFLLFLMGIEFDLKSLKYLGRDILLVAVEQSIIFFGVAFLIAKLLGFSTFTSVYIGIFFMFSSTLLVAKWIDDKKETNTLYGKITLGILIVEDIIAIIMLTFLSVLQEKSLIKIFITPLTGIALLLIVVLFARYILNWLLSFAVKYPELLYIFSLGVCFLFVEIAPLLGYSETIGAFLAGIVIANTAYKNDVYTRLKPLIIFFNMLFFVGLGFQLNTPLTIEVIILIIILCILALVLKPIVTYFLLNRRGYDCKTSFIVGLNLSPLSEFGIIVLATGVALGAIGKDIGAMAVISVISTMILSSYLIKYDKVIYRFFEPYLRRFSRKVASKEISLPDNHTLSDFSIVFFGYHELGQELSSNIRKMGKKILVVENDPKNVEMLKKEKIPFVYSSVNNPEFFEHIDFSNAELVISSIIDIEDNKSIIAQVKKQKEKCLVVVTAKNLRDTLELYSNNADYVICPFYLREQYVAELLEEYTLDKSKIIEKRNHDIAEIRQLDQKKTEEGHIFKLDLKALAEKFRRKKSKRKK